MLWLCQGWRQVIVGPRLGLADARLAYVMFRFVVTVRICQVKVVVSLCYGQYQGQHWLGQVIDGLRIRSVWLGFMVKLFGLVLGLGQVMLGHGSVNGYSQVMLVRIVVNLCQRQDQGQLKLGQVMVRVMVRKRSVQLAFGLGHVLLRSNFRLGKDRLAHGSGNVSNQFRLGYGCDQLTLGLGLGLDKVRFVYGQGQ